MSYVYLYWFLGILTCFGVLVIDCFPIVIDRFYTKKNKKKKSFIRELGLTNYYQLGMVVIFVIVLWPIGLFFTIMSIAELING